MIGLVWGGTSCRPRIMATAGSASGCGSGVAGVDIQSSGTRLAGADAYPAGCGGKGLADAGVGEYGARWGSTDDGGAGACGSLPPGLGRMIVRSTLPNGFAGLSLSFMAGLPELPIDAVRVPASRPRNASRSMRRC